LQLTASVIRDLFTPQVERVIVDSRKLYKEITTYLTASSPHLLDKIELYKGNISIFENFGLEREISSTYKRKVHLKSGASIVIDQTEAMIVVDVNSGRAVENDQEKTALVINLDALKEIAKQIRLRDIAGIILIDFIDMQQEANRKKLFNEMKRELYKDRAKSVVYPVTQLGLMQITRQRINQNIAEKISEPCPTCNGSGRIANKSSVLNEIDDWIFSFRNNSQEFRLQLVVHPKIAEYLTEGEVSLLSKLMMKHFVKIKLLQSDNLPFGHFQVFSLKQNKDITKEYL
jgi:ribonuclease G